MSRSGFLVILAKVVAHKYGIRLRTAGALGLAEEDVHLIAAVDGHVAGETYLGIGLADVAEHEGVLSCGCAVVLPAVTLFPVHTGTVLAVGMHHEGLFLGCGKSAVRTTLYLEISGVRAVTLVEQESVVAGTRRPELREVGRCRITLGSNEDVVVQNQRYDIAEPAIAISIVPFLRAVRIDCIDTGLIGPGLVLGILVAHDHEHGTVCIYRRSAGREVLGGAGVVAAGIETPFLLAVLADCNQMQAAGEGIDGVTVGAHGR